MFNRKPIDDTHPLDELIEHLTSVIFKSSDLGSEESARTAEILKVAMELRTADKAATKQNTMTPDMIAAIIGNLTGIILILGFEKAGIITSKGLSFVPKIRF